MVVARLERDVRRRAVRIVSAAPSVEQRFDLGVRLAAPMMPALAERRSLAHDDAPDRWVRRGIGDRARAELDRAREVAVVVVYDLTSTPFQNAT
jgi:hypothetical protein